MGCVNETIYTPAFSQLSKCENESHPENAKVTGTVEAHKYFHL